MTCFIARAYGREAFIRSCALRIFDAETISSARVTLRVFCTLLILVLISLPPATSTSQFRRCSNHSAAGVALESGIRDSKKREWRDQALTNPQSRIPALLPGPRLLEFIKARLELAFDVVVPVAGGDDVLHQLGVVVVEMLVQGGFEGQDLGDRQ